MAALAAGAALGLGGAEAATTLATGAGAAVGDYQPSIALTQIVQSVTGPPCCGVAAVDDIGMIRTFGGVYGAFGAQTANGQLMSVAANPDLYGALGTTYGGDGVHAFGLPDLGGRTIVGAGQGIGLSSWALAQGGGQGSVTLTTANLPAHAHGLTGGGSTGVTGSGQGFSNLQPSLALNYMIAVDAVFPTANGIAPITGQVAAFAGATSPAGWLPADGRLLDPNAYPALFAILGCNYGGDCASTFALPDLRGRTAVGAGAGLSLAQAFGGEAATLGLNQLPSHDHGLPGGGATGLTGGGQTFDNAQPSLAINWLVNIEGIYPARDGAGAPPDQPFLGEIIGFAGNFFGEGWALAQGQLMSINQNQALYSLFGCTYGGDCQVTFALPDLRGLTVIGTNGAFGLGAHVGERDTTLSVAQLPSHTHSLPNAVPEPGTWALMLAGVALTGGMIRRRRAQAAGA